MEPLGHKVLIHTVALWPQHTLPEISSKWPTHGIVGSDGIPQRQDTHQMVLVGLIMITRILLLNSLQQAMKNFLRPAILCTLQETSGRLFLMIMEKHFHPH